MKLYWTGKKFKKANYENPQYTDYETSRAYSNSLIAFESMTDREPDDESENDQNVCMYVSMNVCCTLTPHPQNGPTCFYFFPRTSATIWKCSSHTYIHTSDKLQYNVVHACICVCQIIMHVKNTSATYLISKVFSLVNQ